MSLNRYSSSMPARRKFAASALLFLLMPAAAAHTDGHAVPDDPDTVPLTLPVAATALNGELRMLHAALDADPGREAIAVRLAWSYADLHRLSGDPRYLGHAEAVLLPFLKQERKATTASAELRLVHAQLLQARHDFDAAVDILDNLARSGSRDPRVWLLLASINEITGEYEKARRACGQLLIVGDILAGSVCGASIASLTGRSAQALASLEAVLDEARGRAGDRVAWGHTVAGEIAARLDDPARAESHFRTALALDPGVYPAVTLADLMLAQGRYQAVLDTLDKFPDADAVLLRRAVAARRTQSANADEISERIRQRLDGTRISGDTPHYREEAFHALWLADDPARALAIARKNFAGQRESIDALLLLEAALAAGRPAAARPALEWMEANGSDDRRLRDLSARLGERT